MERDLLEQISVTKTDALIYHDLLTDFAATDHYRADEAQIAADGIARQLWELLDTGEELL